MGGIFLPEYCLQRHSAVQAGNLWHQRISFYFMLLQ
jgi:hypothetical protein